MRSPRTAGVISVLFGLGLLWLGLGNYAWNAGLAREGRQALAVVLAYTPDRITSKSSSTRHLHLVEYDGHRATLNLHRQMAPGTKVPVLYRTDRPSVVARGQAGMSAFRLMGTTQVIVMAVQVLFGLIGVGAGVRSLAR